jgi:hypothetical protein
MAREFFDYDPVTGVTEYVEWNTDGTFSIHSEQDVQPMVDYCKHLANTGGTDHNFRGENWLYASIPPVVQAQMFKKGINILDPNHTKAVVDEVNANYPHLKTTHRHHALIR